MTTELSPIDAKKQELDGLKLELSEAQAIANQELSELMASNPTYDLTLAAKMGEINKPIAAIQTKLDKVNAEFKKISGPILWEMSEPVREPVLTILKDTFVSSPVTFTLASISGSIKIVDGKAVVSLNATAAPLDMTNFEATVASSIDVSAYQDANMVDLEVSVADIATSEPLVTLSPAKKATKTGIVRSKPREYFAGGKWVSAKDFLAMLIQNGDPVAAQQSKSFNYAVQTGSGAFDKAVTSAKRLGVESREKVKTPTAA